MQNTGFTYSATDCAEVLILGSMPGRKSLTANQYYAHAQNAFWPIMAELFNFDVSLAYRERLERLKVNHVALWDVAHRCIRRGSMDHDINIESVVANNFADFFHSYTHIHTIFFNGRKAEELYRKLVMPVLTSPYHHIEQHLLPSTSPANAAITRSDKLTAWRIVARTLEMN